MKLAIIEDDINMRKSLEIALNEYKEFEVVSFKNAKDALKKIDDSIDLVVTDINMPGIDGIDFLKELNGRYEAIIITGNATLNRAVEALRLGVKDFLTKPFEIETLVEAIKRSQKVQAAKKNSNNSNKTGSDSGFIAESPELNRALNIAKKAAMTDASVMLLGESGVGKEVMASFVHKNSPRAKSSLIAINMAAIPENLLESELFGYEKGAFTDATEGRAGKFEAAKGGTIFLDEIGEMPLNLQAKILRVLQEREVTRLGSSKSTKIDVRVISATNADIRKKILDGEFREDLYFRLNTIPVNIPPLRQRREEIIPIAEAILLDVCKKYEFKRSLGEEAKQRLQEYKWPGNIRELISVIERAAILSEGESIKSEDLFLDSREGKDRVFNLEKELLLEALKSSGNSIDEAAKVLGMEVEKVRNRCKKYNIKVSE
ncbi:MAG: sigma-54-dependent transcriptional regulator [Campylobacterales bacterium]